ncbi:NADP-dependent oxidoreductase domain-containing protein 1 [Oopsacas minuta]|uniref:NADP-dependent oxidoreductase domain-containing protein 1 n=1 Tax=Oopsacas minuta TaxID=111878 RepID=A0AAV7K5N7_9METZ|nr:NADP-dependent oxidoreductase domain-containing protein 1 [Oopsacas minuta]
MSLPHIDDLIGELPSLQLENTLTPSEIGCLPLRLQSNAFLLTALTQCRYLIHTWKALKEVCPTYKKSSSKSYTSLHTLSSISRTSDRTDSTFCIGVIGCGRIGSHLVRKLLQDPNITPDMIRLSTRQPDHLQEFESQGVTCRFDNIWLANNSDVIIICCLPSQIAPVLLDLSKSSISNTTLLVSILAGVGVNRIRRALNDRTNVMRVYFDWSHLSLEDRGVMSIDSYGVSNRMSRHKLALANCPFKTDTGCWFGEFVVSCIAYCLNQLIVASEIGNLVCNLIADESVDVNDLLPDVKFDKKFISKFLEKEGEMTKLGSVLEKKEMRDLLVEKYWQRVREVEPSLLDIAKTQTPTKL